MQVKLEFTRNTYSSIIYTISYKKNGEAEKKISGEAEMLSTFFFGSENDVDDFTGASYTSEQFINQKGEWASIRIGKDFYKKLRVKIITKDINFSNCPTLRPIESTATQTPSGLPITENHTGYLDVINVETLFKKLHFNPNNENATFLSYSVKHTPNTAQWGVYIPKWLSDKDIEYLISQLDSDEESKIMVSTYSSHIPFGEKNEIKNYAALFLELYRNDGYFRGLVVDPHYSSDAIQELKDWWKQNRKGIDELEERPINATHNYSINFIREILNQEVLTKDQEFEDFVKDCDFSASLDMTRDLNGDKKQGWSIRSHEGVFGNDYHRIDFFINDVKKSPQNPHNYLVKGKSRLKDNICDFEGEIKITEIRKNKNSDIENPQGVLVASYSFRENKNQYGSGEFNGYFSSGLIGKGKLGSWDEIRETDLFGTFVGTWKGYKTGITKKCIWNYHTNNIPLSEDFHTIPQSEIDARNQEIEKTETPLTADEMFGKAVNPKYRKNGWDKPKWEYNKGWWNDEKPTSIKEYTLGDVKVIVSQLNNSDRKITKDFLCRGKITSYKSGIAIDSLKFDDMEAVGDRYGFNFSSQPIEGIIIGSKFGDYNGRILLIDESGKIQNYAGGFFLVSRNKEQHYLISRWHSDLAGITVYDLKNKKLLMEKQTDIYPANWYYFEGEYYISEWDNKETENIFRLDIDKGELIKSTKKLAEIQKGELLDFFNTEFCDCY